MKKKLLFITIFSLLASHAAFCQENETNVSLQIRPRAEYRNGVLYPRNENDLPTAFINNRARLSIDYKRGNSLMMKFSGQHVGVWGQDPQIDPNGRFAINEAWARINFRSCFFVQLGRQSLIYDDERILGGLDWNVAGRSHDALKIAFENNMNKLHMILAFNQNQERIIGGTYYAQGGQPYKTMQTLWYQYNNTNTPFNVSAIAMNLGLEAGTEDESKTKYMQTLGVNAGYGISGFNFAGTFYYQLGKTTANADISAWMGSLNISYKITSKWNIGVGTDYLSGNIEGSTMHNAFNPLYGTHHKFYGSMDYFFASQFVGNINPGLWDNYARVSFKPIEKLNLSLHYHNFTLAQDVTFNNEKISRGLGSEIDFQFDWIIMKDVRMSGGYSFMLGTSSMDVVKGGDHRMWQDWGWISLNINPGIFFSKW